MSDKPKYDNSPVARQRDLSLARLRDNRLGAAIDAYVDALTAVGAPASLMSRATSIREDYDRLAASLLRGESDPLRRSVFNGLALRLIDQWTRLDRQLQARDNPSQYFSTLRYERMHSADTFAALGEQMAEANDRVAMLRLAAEADGTAGLLRHKPEWTEALKHREELARRIFNRLWTGFPLAADARQSLWALLDSPDYPVTLRSLMVSALTLGQLQYYDDVRMRLLIDLYTTASAVEVRLRALIGMLLSMWVHRDRPESRDVAAMLDALDDDPQWHKDIVTAYKQLIRSRDTKRINRKFEQEILPEMMKMRPEMMRRLRKLRDADFDSDEAPELEDMIDNSRLKDKLKELSEMQEEGSDVFMTTFSNLKNFDFFRELSNWFLPFTTEHTAFCRADYDSVMKWIEILGAAPLLCDNDKFSMALAMERLPQAQRDMMTGQMAEQMRQAGEINASSLLPDRVNREGYINRYVQDLYRFYNLYPRHKEWSNPFDTALNLLAIDRLKPILGDTDTLIVVAEFYFKRGYYEDARRLLELLADKMPPTEAVYQKLGYCARMTGDIDGAIDNYEKSDLINSASVWILRQLSACHIIKGNMAAALDTLRRALKIKPDDMKLADTLSTVLMETGRVRDALNNYYAMDLKRPGGDPRSLRGIGRCSYLLGDFERARDYYDRLNLIDGLTAADHLTLGAVELTGGNPEAASVHWAEARKAAPDDFEQMLRDERDTLTSHGVEPLTLDILTDIITKNK